MELLVTALADIALIMRTRQTTALNEPVTGIGGAAGKGK